jgi:hypothetical protein
MTSTTRRAAVVATAAALGIGVLGVTAPALAGSGSPAGPSGTAQATRFQDRSQIQDRVPGCSRNRSGTVGGPRSGQAGDCGCRLGTVTAAKGSLTAAQRATLAGMAEEEKLAGDLYAAFADRYDAAVFAHIGRAEDQHLAAVRVLLGRYDVPDPTTGKAAGRFSDPAVQATYDRLLAQGLRSLDAALDVGRSVEQTDVADLRSASSGLTAPDVRQVYSRLLAASERHLAAFERWSSR